MAGVHQLQPTVAIGFAQHKCCELSRKSALAKCATGNRYDLFDRLARRQQSPQGGVQVRHQHRRRHSFARDIAQSKIERIRP